MTKWLHVAAHVKSRNSMQCRERWKNNLAPEVKFFPWTPAEDKILFDYLQKYVELNGMDSKVKCKYYLYLTY